MSKLENLIKNLKKANKRLKEALRAKPTRMNKDAAIQRFEFTFELAECLSPKNCIREAARLEIIDNPEDWIEYLKARNLTAHTYNEKMADKIYHQARKFPKEVEKLLERIQ